MRIIYDGEWDFAVILVLGRERRLPTEHRTFRK